MINNKNRNNDNNSILIFYNYSLFYLASESCQEAIGTLSFCEAHEVDDIRTVCGRRGFENPPASHEGAPEPRGPLNTGLCR